MITRKFIDMSKYTKNTERNQINYLMLHLNSIEKQQTKLKTSRRREKIKRRAKSKQRPKSIQRINETNS
jgi:hypothetical protein